MTITNAQLRLNFPEFADAGIYPEPELTFWLGLGAKLLSAERWGDLLDYGLQLFTAHNLSLEFNAKRAAAVGANPGSVIGVQSSGTVDKVSYTRDTHSVMDPKNGHWNLSIYGLRYIALVKMVGAGPVYVGASVPCATSSAWVGPLFPPNLP